MVLSQPRAPLLLGLCVHQGPSVSGMYYGFGLHDVTGGRKFGSLLHSMGSTFPDATLSVWGVTVSEAYRPGTEYIRLTRPTGGV